MTTTVPINIHHINAWVYRVHELGNGFSSLKIRTAKEQQPASFCRPVRMDKDIAEYRILLLMVCTAVGDETRSDKSMAKRTDRAPVFQHVFQPIGFHG